MKIGQESRKFDLLLFKYAHRLCGLAVQNIWCLFQFFFWFSFQLFSVKIIPFFVLLSSKPNFTFFSASPRHSSVHEFGHVLQPSAKNDKVPFSRSFPSLYGGWGWKPW
jgi:hypothetical protein